MRDAVRTTDVLHVINDVDTGGAQRLVLNLASGSRDLRHAALVLRGPGHFSERLERVMVSVDYVGMSRSNVNIVKPVSALARAVKRLRPGIVHSHLTQSDAVVSLLFKGSHGVRAMTTIHSTGTGEGERWRSKVLAKLAAHVGHFDAIVACTAAAADYGRSLGYNADKVVTIPNGVPIPEFAQRRLRSPKTILVAARNHPMKDYPNLFAALRIVADACEERFRVICAGAGTDNDDMRAMATSLESHGVPVTLLGSYASMSELYDCADFLVLASAYGEALPMAGLEAMAAGVPVIATDVGDCATLVIESWALVPAREPAVLAAAVIRALSLNESGYLRLAEAARLRAELEFSAEVCVAAYESVYSGLLSSGGTRP